METEAIMAEVNKIIDKIRTMSVDFVGGDMPVSID